MVVVGRVSRLGIEMLPRDVVQFVNFKALRRVVMNRHDLSVVSGRYDNTDL